MRVLAHPDPLVLEHELLARLNADHPRDGLGRTLVVVPSNRLAAHVQHRLATASPRAAWLGLHVSTFATVARSVLETRGDVVPRIAPRRPRETLIRRILERQPDNLWARAVARRPGMLGRLRAAVDDLREAGVTAAELARAAERRPADAALAKIFNRYVAELTARARQGWVDEAGLVRAALPHAAPFARGFRSIFLYGAYELIGVHVELVRALGRGAPLTALLPWRPDSRVTRYCEDFARRHLMDAADEPQPVHAAPDVGCGLALQTLYDESARPHPARANRLSWRNTQGPTAEVEVAARAALAAIADGCPPSEIAIVARALEPYAPAIEAAFADAGLNWTSTLTAPLRRQPMVRTFLLLLDVVAQDYPRRATVELLRAQRIRWSRLLGDAAPPRGDQADRLSRRAGLVGGLDEWTEAFPRWASDEAHLRHADERERAAARERNERHARSVARALRALHERVRPTSRRWSEHARHLRDLLDELIGSSPDPRQEGTRETLAALLDEMELQESWAGADEPVPFRQMCAWLDEATLAAELELAGPDLGGVRVLDLMQFRGLTCRRVMLLGLNSGVFPRAPREDPVLGDQLRSRLREATGRALTVSSETPAEERLLLLLGLGAAREATEVSWQRADEHGRSRSPSLALRELARLCWGIPDLDRLLRESRVVPSHPTQWLAELATGARVLSESDTMLLAALEGYGPQALDVLARRFPELETGMRMLRATQAFRPVDPTFDGRVDRCGIPADGLSVSALETLGRCPLQFMFRHVLDVREPDRETDPLELARDELGRRVHAALERTYRLLADEGLFERRDRDALLARAQAVLEAARGRLFGETVERLTRRYPVLWHHVLDDWFRALVAFVRADLSRIVDDGWRLAGIEELRQIRLDLGEGIRLDVRGRFDRCLDDGRRLLVGDYKTSGSLADKTRVSPMLRGQRMQVPLYAMLAGRGALVELLGVGPAYEDGDVEPRSAFDGFANDAQRRGFLESLRLLHGLASRGRYPLHADRHCDWCDYLSACRRNHPPSREREEQYGDARRYAAMLGKTERRPLLGSAEGS